MTMAEPSRFLIACFAAFLCAALAPVLVLFGLGENAGILYYALWVTSAHAILFGLPAFLYLRSKQRINFISVICAGFAIGAVPSGILLWPLTFRDGTNAWSDDIRTIIDGVPTWAGWTEYAQVWLYFGGLGALGGMVFWLVQKLAGYSNGFHADVSVPRFTRYAGIGMALFGLVAAGTIFALPTITMDRSCHNMARDGRTSIKPKLHMALDIAMEDWPILTKITEDFGAAHSLSVRISGTTDSKALKSLYLSLCSEAGTNIDISEQRWASRNFAPLFPKGTPISIYEPNENPDTWPLARAFVKDIESAWPGKLKFLDPVGRLTSPPPELAAPAASPE